LRDDIHRRRLAVGDLDGTATGLDDQLAGLEGDRARHREQLGGGAG